jgi:uncharacterized protein YndB with AHSA1/START domain
MSDPSTGATAPAAIVRSTQHAMFSMERTFGHPPARVFRAFAEPAAKAAWFVGPDGRQSSGHTLDFRVGGREHLATDLPGGGSVTFDATYLDIVTDERIIYAYEMTIDGRRISASLASLELRATPAGTHLTLTEHGIFLDGLDRVEERERGTRELLDKLQRWVDEGDEA